MTERLQSIQTYARIAGALLLVSIFVGGFGEAYAPSKIIVANNAAATAGNLLAHPTILRLGFAAYLVEALCDVMLSLLFYALLRPVHRDLSLLAAFLGLIGTAIFAVGEVAYFSTPLLLRDSAYLATFSPDQRNALALVATQAVGYGATVSMLFYGAATFIRGYLFTRSGYFPKFLGILLMIAGLGFMTKTFTFVLAPRYATDVLLYPMFIAMLAIAFWFIAKGVNVPGWNARIAADEASQSDG